MRELDDTDLGILRLLVDDARRSYSDIADRVNVSAPTVSDRIDRLKELGVINGFTVDLNRERLTDGTEILVTIELRASADTGTARRLASVDRIEHVAKTADSRLVVIASTGPGRVRDVLGQGIDLDQVESFRVHLVEDRYWSPSIGSAELALTCDECSNSVNPEGVSIRLDGELYHFCCSTCRSSFEERYTTLRESA